MKVPASGHHREALRTKGQFWTPEWVADAMVRYVLADGAKELFDPGVGAGAFFRSGRRLFGPQLSLKGREVDPAALLAARESGLTNHDLSEVQLRDFVLDPPSEKFPAIVANPPYVRHHRLSDLAKLTLHTFAREFLGHPIDGRAGLHVFFLLHCLQALAPNGRLAFIVSADICEGVFSRSLWQWIGTRYRLDAVATFSTEASPFPGIDTNAVLFLIRNAAPATHFTWAQVLEAETQALTDWIKRGCKAQGDDRAIRALKRQLSEGLATGLSREPANCTESRYVLGDFARVMRGIATGDNDYFFMTPQRAAELEIPDRYFVPAVGRLRDIERDFFTKTDLLRLEAQGRPTRLLSLGHEPKECLPFSLQNYLAEGERNGLPASTLISTRKPWYRMERREPPAFFFAYLGRRDVRFIRNMTDAVPLTCLLCVYPYNTDLGHVDRLWRVLSDPQTVANLRLVGKSYGDGALKVEPRALQQLPLPDALIAEHGLSGSAGEKQTELILREQHQADYRPNLRSHSTPVSRKEPSPRHVKKGTVKDTRRIRISKTKNKIRGG